MEASNIPILNLTCHFVIPLSYLVVAEDRKFQVFWRPWTRYFLILWHFQQPSILPARMRYFAVLVIKGPVLCPWHCLRKPAAQCLWGHWVFSMVMVMLMTSGTAGSCFCFKDKCLLQRLRDIVRLFLAAFFSCRTEKSQGMSFITSWRPRNFKEVSGMESLNRGDNQESGTNQLCLST